MSEDDTDCPYCTVTTETLFAACEMEDPAMTESNQQVVSLSSLREMFYSYQEETGRLPKRVHLTKNQIGGLAHEAKALGMNYEGDAPKSIWFVSIVESETGPHLAG